jgi:3-oxoacyl-[acyl-carrier protein] reductase
LCARTQSTLDAAAEEIRRDTGVEVLARAIDVTAHEQVRAFVAEIAAHFGRLDICVANAGGPPSKSFADTTVDDWHTAAELNLMSTVYLAKETLPLMQQRRWGRFIAITSVTVKQPLDGLILSNAVRAGVLGLVKSLANEYGPYNVLVNNVCPGFTATARLNELAETLAAKGGVSPATSKSGGPARRRSAASASLRNSPTWWSFWRRKGRATLRESRSRWMAGW